MVRAAAASASSRTRVTADWIALLRQAEWGIAGPLLALYAVLVSITVWTRSPTFDEPLHLTAGYAALAEGDHRIDPSHPPLARMTAALPLLAMGAPSFDASTIDALAPEPWLRRQVDATRAYFYAQSDPDRLLRAARLGIVVWGVAMGALLFGWVREWLGRGPALIALCLYVAEPNLNAHAALVTTDLAMSGALVATVYALWRVTRHPTGVRALILAASVSLALTTKFTALLVAPVVVLGLAASVRRGGALTWSRAAAIGALVAVVSVAGIWAVYGFRYEPSATPGWVFRLEETSVVADRADGLGTIVRWIDANRLLPNAYSQGLLFSLATSRTQAMYLLGEIGTDGWWYYFPVAFLLKTPPATVGLFLIGIVVGVRRGWRGRPLEPSLFLLAPIAIVLAAAMMSGVNIGVRHILPIYPFVLVVAAAGVVSLWQSRRWIGRLTAVASLVAVVGVFARAYPRTLTYFSGIVGGPSQGIRYLADSNVDWGQHLHLLAAWMRRERVDHVSLAYFGTADPRYYGIRATLLPGTPEFDGVTIGKPVLPGYVALSVNMLSGQYLRPEWRLYYREFLDRAPDAVIGNTIRVYWVDRWPHSAPERRAADRVEVVRALAHGLLRLGDDEQATLHFSDLIAREPTDARARAGLGGVLIRAGRVREGLEHLQTAVDLAPGDVSVRFDHGVALLLTGHSEQAAVAADAWLRIAPYEAAAWHFLGLARRAQGRFVEARSAQLRALQVRPTFAPAREALVDLEAS